MAYQNPFVEPLGSQSKQFFIEVRFHRNYIEVLRFLCLGESLGLKVNVELRTFRKNWEMHGTEY